MILGNCYLIIILYFRHSKLAIMKKLISTLSILALISIGSCYAQFQGIIEFDKIKTETTKYSYAVKGNKVRIEETATNGEVKGIMIVDLDKETVTALSPERKLFMDATNKRVAPPISPEITKTKNTKEIKGYSCSEWIVKYPMEETQISYWVTDKGEFTFFNKLLLILNRKDRLSTYFLSVPGHESVFTLDGIEKGLDGTVKTELRITKIEKKQLSDQVFEIPSDYVKFER